VRRWDYGAVTLVPSPEFAMVNVPAVATGVYAYEPQPGGGVGVRTMKGPAVWPRLFVTAEFRSVRVLGSVREGGVHGDGGGQDVQVRVGLRDSGLARDPAVDGDRDRREDADDGHDDHELEQILCVEEERVVGRDNVVAADGVALQLGKQPGRRTCAGLHVLVRRHLDGRHSVWYGARCLTRYDARADGRPDAMPFTRAVISRCQTVAARSRINNTALTTSRWAQMIPSPP
jgi:hypothetical protein